MAEAVQAQGGPSFSGAIGQWVRVFVPALSSSWLQAQESADPTSAGWQVSSSQTNYLPESADATVAGAAGGVQRDPSAIIVFESAEPLATQREQMAVALSALTELRVAESPAIPHRTAWPPRRSPWWTRARSHDRRDALGPAGERARRGQRSDRRQASSTAGFTGIDSLLLAVTLIAVFIIWCCLPFAAAARAVLATNMSY